VKSKVSRPNLPINLFERAGGGGKTKHRQAKISEKNQKLNEERVRRLREEEREKLDRKDMTIIHHDEVHPSRRGQVPQ
jgi:nucleolar protein 6